MCSQWVQREATLLGGPGKIVEVDEAAFGKRKFNRGKVRKTIWVIGGVERSQGGVFLEVVPDRTSATLQQVISKWVEPGTTIITDEWKGYRSLSQSGFKHRTVCHKLHFVNPQNGAHTQTIEGMWQHVRALFPLHGGRPSKVQHYLDEFVFRRNNKDAGVLVLHDIINLIE